MFSTDCEKEAWLMTAAITLAAPPGRASRPACMSSMLRTAGSFCSPAGGATSSGATSRSSAFLGCRTTALRTCATRMQIDDEAPACRRWS